MAGQQGGLSQELFSPTPSLSVLIDARVSTGTQSACEVNSTISPPPHTLAGPAVVAPACNPSPLEAEEGGLQ